MIARRQNGLHLSVDGTFAACCPLWEQQYGVLVKHKDCLVMSPCALILMPSRKKSVYDLVFNDLLQLFTSIKITSCIADFEERAARSFREVFNSRQDLVAEFKMSLSFFHFNK
ncbi:hypothetical protein Pmar_PMAR028878 [Perkinsus marinus ATCC 50983]|uniref:MULE transposase domain-containing protein n=1 Tax=Perkinsus marinus (strain ATCC 50983 / TXsc) TaxID=423536 RepID=C5KLW5_PERM5|nr:hypothetical protein Pmar_PMAR021545 [Perkinsus marinus ATCC 50983]XP_002782733.1 hypothetical protein Pmar_PMAR028878 [Perkinsus marinus ATCC 50983]EER09801.1 hypothetical protein Pmar_PMAR021545 [Perkinsus marinus ATCC 50983]EER14528.1 hypothetical protein Pmar_PMAR028878 [Perkinsus marinus ATCC 50983]|eukprot:XP_002778006.1 hypothetical protein Pmar_PMAR021545 [Perkinsus marinus ATCC 50983]